MDHLTGAITVVQEARFQVSTDDGRSKLFVLSHSAPIEPRDLQQLADDAVPVTVYYTPLEGAAAWLARNLVLANGRPRRHQIEHQG